MQQLLPSATVTTLSPRSLSLERWCQGKEEQAQTSGMYM